MLATDRYRLAIRELEWNPQSPDASAAALIPARVLSETAKAMTGTDIIVSLAAPGTGDGIVGFEGEVAGGNRRATTRLLDGEFPKVRGIIPTDAAIATRVRIDTATLVEAVKRVALVAERNAPVRLTFDEDTVTLDAGSGDEAQASESIEARVVGEPVTVGFNPTYLLDGLERDRYAGRAPGVHAGDEAGRTDRCEGLRRRTDQRVPLRADAGPPEQLNQEANRTRGFTMELGLVGLGKMGGNMRERIRERGP